MSLTKEKIAFMVIKGLSGGKEASFIKADPRDIYERIETTRNLMMELAIREFGDLDGEFVTQYKDCEVLCDPVTNKKYTILPTRLISFGDYSGLRQISPMKDQSQSFIKVDNGFESTFSGLEASNLAGHTGYYLERVKRGTNQSIQACYVNIPFQYDKVLVKMIASTYDFEENEALPIPAKYEEQLIMTVGQAFSQSFQIPQDLREGLTPENA